MLIAELHQAAKDHLPRLPLRDLILGVQLETSVDGHLQPHVIANLKKTLTAAYKMAPSEDAKEQLQSMLSAMPQ